VKWNKICQFSHDCLLENPYPFPPLLKNDDESTVKATFVITGYNSEGISKEKSEQNLALNLTSYLGFLITLTTKLADVISRDNNFNLALMPKKFKCHSDKSHVKNTGITTVDSGVYQFDRLSRWRFLGFYYLEIEVKGMLFCRMISDKALALFVQFLQNPSGILQKYR